MEVACLSVIQASSDIGRNQLFLLANNSLNSIYEIWAIYGVVYFRAIIDIVARPSGDPRL